MMQHPIEVTETAALHALSLAQRDNRPARLRLGVRGGGCWGYSYFWRFEENLPSDNDVVWQVAGLTIVVDHKSKAYLLGSVFHYNRSLLKRGFAFQNPLASGTCSCGQSFAVTKAAKATDHNQ